MKQQSKWGLLLGTMLMTAVTMVAQNLNLPVGELGLTVTPSTKEVRVERKTLKQTEGVIIRITASKLIPVSTSLKWTFGRCVPDCDHNLISLEGQAFTCYYGEPMKLRTVQGLLPAHGSTVKDGLLSGLCPIQPGQELYLCIYKANAEADWNYYQLPQLWNETR